MTDKHIEAKKNNAKRFLFSFSYASMRLLGKIILYKNIIAMSFDVCGGSFLQ